VLGARAESGHLRVDFIQSVLQELHDVVDVCQKVEARRFFDHDFG
jgi:hypothetical protein